MTNDDSSLIFNATFDIEAVMLSMSFLMPSWIMLSIMPQNNGAWIAKYSMDLAVVLTRLGFCRTFNIVEPDEFLHLEKYGKCRQKNESSDKFT